MLLLSNAFGIEGPPAIQIDLFNRPDSASIGSDWTRNLLGGNSAIVDAKLSMTSSTGAYAGGSVAYLSAMPATVDQEVYIETLFDTPISEHFAQIAARVQNSTDYSGPNATTGYTIVFIRSTGEVQIQKPGTNLGKYTIVSGGFPQNTTWSLRWRLFGNSIKWKVWQTGTTEPYGWTQELSDSTWSASGRVMLSVQNGNDGAARTVKYNDLRVSPLATPTGAHPAYHYTGTPSYKKGLNNYSLFGGSLSAVVSDLGSAGWTIEGWGYVPAANTHGDMALFGYSNTAQSGSGWFGVSANNGTAGQYGTGGITVSQGWHHFAVVTRSDGSYCFYVDGQYIGNNGDDRLIQLTDIYLGGWKTAGKEWNSGVDEIRLSRGQRYPFYNNFTPPTAPLSVDGTTVALYHFENDGTDSVAASVSGGNAKVYIGGSFTAKPVKVWTGSAWIVKPVKVWTGSVWKTTTY